MPRRRTLRPEEAADWQAVARTARPLHPGRAETGPSPPPPARAPTSSHAPPGPPSEPLPAFRIGERTATRAVPPQPSAPPPRMDSRAFARLARGRLAPEARLDLHGMTLAEAQPELVRFVLSAQARGLRLVLVITGKGRPAPAADPFPRATGALRREVPHWLGLPPLSAVVQETAPAHRRHGGEGALYLWLRRRP